MIIPFNIESGGFRETILSALKEHESLASNSGPISIDLGAEASGYSGKVRVAIQSAADEGFSVVSGWSGKDPTRFPARIRAAATSIKDIGHEGEYFIHHDDGVIKIQKVSGKPNPVIFGEVPGVKSGDTFPDRQAMHDANVHRGIVQGIAAEGSAIVLNEGYVDDEDNGDIIIYTGQGGQDSKNVQVADQELRAGNKFLARNYAEGIPVRVSRGPKLKSPYAPKKGYQYGGLYRIDHYWSDIGVHGFAIYRYRLIRIASQESVPVPAAGDSPARPLPQGNQTPDRVTTTTQRVVRSTRIGKAIKKLYDYTCQVCGTRLEIHSGAYAECCHIKPLGKPHNGPDVMENVLCLCPNCHVLFDHHVITLEDDLSIPQRGTKLNVAATHKLDLGHIRYHRDRVQAS